MNIYMRFYIETLDEFECGIHNGDFIMDIFQRQKEKEKKRETSGNIT